MYCNPRFLQVHTLDRKERIPPSGLSHYQISTSIQTEGYLNSILTWTSGLKCGIVQTFQTATSLPTGYGSRVTAI